MTDLTRSGGRKPAFVAIALAAGIAIAFPAYVHADAISPAIKPTGKKYSKEKPDVTTYGTGPGGRLMEASVLRFDIERHLDDGDYDLAIKKARKACQLDPGDPESHMLLAKSLTQKLEQTKGKIDEKILSEAMEEWRLLWLHNADQSEQVEAKMNFMRMKLVARGLAKQHQLEEKNKLKAKQELEARQEQAGDSKKPGDGKAADGKSANSKTTDDKTDKSADASGDKSDTDNDGVEIAHKHKRFFLF